MGSKKFDKTKSLAATSSQKFGRQLIPAQDKGANFITFSFRYFDQQKYFGFGQEESKWFASLLERLKDFSGKTSKIIEDHKERDAYRLHPINWDGRNVPVTLEDFKSIPDVVRNSAENEFLWQFQLSTGNGRVIGFFNSTFDVFYVVALDPLHNLQPSKDFAYRVEEAEIAPTIYEDQRIKINEILKRKNACEYSCSCPLSSNIDSVFAKSDAIFFSIESDLFETYSECILDGSLEKEIGDFLTSRFVQKSL